jgi:hypothetical protein
MEWKLSKEEKQILLHSLGLSNLRWYDKAKLKDKPDRNYFYTSKDTKDYPFIEKLIEKKLMVNSEKGWENQEGTYFHVTTEGIKIALEIARKEIKENTPSRSKRRYQLYLHFECCESFGEWLKNPYWDDCRKRHNCA